MGGFLNVLQRLGMTEPTASNTAPIGTSMGYLPRPVMRGPDEVIAPSPVLGNAALPLGLPNPSAPVVPDSVRRPNFRAGVMNSNIRPGQTPRARRAGGSGMRMY